MIWNGKTIFRTVASFSYLKADYTVQLAPGELEGVT